MTTENSPGAAKILLYSKHTCPFCQWAKQLLAAKNLPWEEFDLLKHPEKTGEMHARTQGARTVPQIFIGTTHVGGFQELAALEQSGELDALLLREGIPAKGEEAAEAGRGEG